MENPFAPRRPEDLIVPSAGQSSASTGQRAWIDRIRPCPILSTMAGLRIRAASLQPYNDPEPHRSARRCADNYAVAFGPLRVQLLRALRGFVPSWILFVARVIGIAQLRRVTTLTTCPHQEYGLGGPSSCRHAHVRFMRMPTRTRGSDCYRSERQLCDEPGRVIESRPLKATGEGA